MRGEPVLLSDIPSKQTTKLLCIHCDAPASYIKEGNSTCKEHK